MILSEWRDNPKNNKKPTGYDEMILQFKHTRRIILPTMNAVFLTKCMAYFVAGLGRLADVAVADAVVKLEYANNKP